MLRLKIRYCAACADFLEYHDEYYYELYRYICEWYLIKNIPFEFHIDDAFLDDDDIFEERIHFLEIHDYIISTESSLDHYQVKPKGIRQKTKNTYYICALGREHG